jgi:hypothetical protein
MLKQSVMFWCLGNPAFKTAGAGKQNAVVVMRRCAGFVAGVGPVLLHSLSRLGK